MARHYEKLQLQFQQQKPNQAVMRQLLKLELSGRRVYVESLRGDVASNTSEVWNAYPCFKSVDECIEEVQRLVAPDDTGYTERILSNMDSMWDKLLCYGLHIQKLKPPSSFDSGAKACVVLKGLVAMFPPSKKSKKAVPLFQQLDMDDDVSKIVKKTIEPKIIFDEDTLFLAVGGCKLKNLKPSEWSRALV
ncbi:hypothetical protein LSAT2_030004, partial [Lamellibrachia satsuma]